MDDSVDNPVELESEVPQPTRIDVRWGSRRGWIAIRNPLTGETVEIVAKGAPKWLFDRLKIKTGALNVCETKYLGEPAKSN